ncbi:Phage-Associated Protein [Spiroplasma kunkelii CR2-3x]|uniref:Phage-Associated Protein n=1 Tax=Spiroplasma kunkelii CR2-3x TaxID=273035 RepID=A0A0K2JFB4_SPIKU|nr:type II toxin-antitoxin system antitoxin SocA domain-containing protein [Spiroplasma kunkelii]ALA97259.1 Phage-Associated Protein [Spiroplasma kunkelii CR2-3x]
MENYGVKNIANYVLKFFYDKEYTDDEFSSLEITNLKMQKVLYFLYGFYFSETGKSLFSDDFIAWKYGPVIKEIYDINKNNITNPYENLRKDIYSNYDFNIKNINWEIIDNILNNIIKLSSWYLVNMSHKKNTPWEKTKENEIISKDLIHDYFKNKELKEK